MTRLSEDVKRECFTNKRRCKLNEISFVYTADRDTKDIIRLRSYSLPDEPNIRVTICQAALATSATTTFFKPISIGDRTFADGGLGANNPVDEVEGEASNIWCSETGNLCERPTRMQNVEEVSKLNIKKRDAKSNIMLILVAMLLRH